MDTGAVEKANRKSAFYRQGYRWELDEGGKGGSRSCYTKWPFSIDEIGKIKMTIYIVKKGCEPKPKVSLFLHLSHFSDLREKEKNILKVNTGQLNGMSF